MPSSRETEPSALQEVPAVDPSALGGNATPPFNEELYNEALTALEGMAEERTTAILATQREAFVEAVGGDSEAQRINLWEIVKKGESTWAYDEVAGILRGQSSNVAKPEEEKDVFDKVVTRVVLDIRGTTDPRRLVRAPDVTDFAAGHELDDLIDTGELQEPVVLAKATQTIQLLLAHGLYKLNKWGNANQLEVALKLAEAYAEWVPAFNPKEAGYDKAETSLISGLAALQVDEISKPNYEYAMPGRRYLFDKITNGLKTIHRVGAHVFLRDYDFSLSQQPTSEQPESN